MVDPILNFNLTTATAGAQNRFDVGGITVGYNVVPEPSSYALLGGLLAMGLVMVRRRI